MFGFIDSWTSLTWIYIVLGVALVVILGMIFHKLRRGDASRPYGEIRSDRKARDNDELGGDW